MMGRKLGESGFESAMNNFKVLVGVATDTGKERESNEDFYTLFDQTNAETCERGFLYAVADGMGGHVAGEKASRMACQGLKAYYELDISPEDRGTDAFLGLLKKVFHRINREIHSYADDTPGCLGMGSTLTAVVIHEGRALLAHVGDSRVYLLRDHQMEQLTVDHTEVQGLVEMGRLKPERAKKHPLSYLLTQAMGVEEDLEEVFVALHKAERGDLFLLCTDGLYNMLPDEEITEIIQSTGSPQEAAGRLVQEANQRGGKDNITAMVMSII